MKRLTAMAAAMAMLGAGMASAQVQPDGYADDRAAIINLQGRYLLAMDFNDPDAYASVFAEDAVLDWAGGEVVGREAIRAFLASGRYNPTAGATEVEGWPAGFQHFITNQVVEVDGDTAHAITYWFQGGNMTDRGKLEFGLFGHYVDRLEKVNGQWLFTRREIYNEGIPNRLRAGTPNPDPFLD
jgi:ketosteroid isomerase-like protein